MEWIVVWMLACGSAPEPEERDPVGVRFLPSGKHAEPLDLVLDLKTGADADVIVPAMVGALHKALQTCSDAPDSQLSILVKVNDGTISESQTASNFGNWSCIDEGLKGLDLTGVTTTLEPFTVFLRPGGAP